MQTGYDKFWIYENRHEPVHNLPKNDNYIYPVLTDNYKQMPNGGYPSNTIVMSLNNVASSQNGQYSRGPHCVWPSSVYSLPFRSSYANNFHSKMFPTQTNNISYSSQLSQPKASVRNSIVYIPQKGKNNNQRNVIRRLPQISNCTDTETARIRVKDVFTLNNNSIYNSVLDNNLVQTQKNKQYNSLNFAANNCNRTCDFKTNLPVSKHLPSSYVQAEKPCLNNQQQFIQYSGAPYQENAQNSSGSQIQPRQRENNLHPAAFKAKSSLIMYLHTNNKNPEEIHNDLCNALNGNKRVTVMPDEGTNNLSNLKTVNSQINPEGTNIDCQDSAQINEELTCDSLCTHGFMFVQNQNQLNFSDKPNHDQAPSLNEISSVEDSRKKEISEQIVTSDTKSFSNNQISSLESNLVKITIPHTGQSTYINPVVEPNIGDRNSSLRLPNSLESQEEILFDALNKTNTQNCIPQNPLPESIQVRRHSCNISDSNHDYNVTPQSNSNDCNSTAMYSNYIYFNVTSPRNPYTPQRFQQEPSDNLKRQKNQRDFMGSKNYLENNTPENLNANIFGGNENINEFLGNSRKTESIYQNKNVLIDVPIKQEISSLGVGNSSIQLDQNVITDQAHEEIKTEKYSEGFEVEKERLPSENSGLEEETLISNSDEGRSIDSNKNEESVIVSKKIIPESKTLPIGCKNVENCTPELEISRNVLNEDDEIEENIEDQERTAEKAKTCIEEGNYVCNINRDKLDLLIQFLKKDDELAKTGKSDQNDNSANENEMSAQKIIDSSTKKKDDNVTRNRRKLSKIHIVKNKNNSREMVSLMSHKISRAEIQDSSKRSHPAKTDGNSGKIEEQKNCSGDIKTNEKPVDSHENEKQKNSDSKSEPKIKHSLVSSQTQESSIDEEKNIVNIMQALQNLKSHFCLSCTLASPIESFWINVISGELRCLNCFKKMTLKTDEKILKLNKSCSDACNSTEPKPFVDDKVQKENENKKDSKFEMVCSKSKCECASEKTNELKVNIKQETVSESAKEKVIHTSDEEQTFTTQYKNAEVKDAIRISDPARKKSVEEQNKLRIGESEEKSEKNSVTKDFTPKTNILEESSKPEIKAKRKPSVKEDFAPDKTQNSEEKASLVKPRKKSNLEESQIATNISTVSHSKQWSDFLGKKTTSKEEMGNPKTKLLYDRLEKEKKSFSQEVGKFTSKEEYTFHKTQISSDGLEQETSGNSEKSVKQCLFMEDVSDISKKDKKQYKDSSTSRRTNSKEELDVYKVSDEEMMGASATKSPSRESFDSHKMHPYEGILKRSTNESLYKSRIHSFPKETSTEHKSKISSKHMKPKYLNLLGDSEKKNVSINKNLEEERSVESVDKLKKRRKSVEEFIPRKIRVVEECSKDEKYAKQFFEKSKITNSSKVDDVDFNNQSSELSRPPTVDLELVPRRKSRDEWLFSKEQPKCEMKDFTESSDKKRRNSTSKENLDSPEHSKKETEYESLISGNNEKEKKYFSRKMSKTSHKKSEKDSFEIKTSSNDDKDKKSSLASKPLKESQRTESEHKISSPGRPFKKKELHEKRRKREEQYDGKITEKKKSKKHKTVEPGEKFGKRHFSEQEVTKGQRCDKSHTRQSKKDRALECIFGRRKEDLVLNEFRKGSTEKPSSGKFLGKLFGRTKKMSWSC